MKIFKNTSGVALIEFAFSAGIFISLLLAFFEIGFMLSVTTGLEAALYYGSRLGITGSKQSEVFSLMTSTYSAYGLGTIKESNITITAYSTLSDLQNSRNGQDGTGTSGQYVLYKATYPNTFITSYLMPSGTKQTITVNTVVKNEAY